MNVNQSVRQFFLDGLFGLGITVVLFLLMNVCAAGLAFYLFSPLISVTIITSFLGTGLGTPLLANVSSRASWLISLFGVSLISWLVSVGSIIAYITLFVQPGYRNSELHSLPVYAAYSAFGAGIGFAIAGLIGLIFQPVRWESKAFLSSMINAFTGYVFPILYVLTAAIPT